MMNKTFVSILAAASVAAVPAIAAADRGHNARRVDLGTVDTHPDDAEDFVTVSPAQYFDTIVVRAHDGVVPLDEVKLQYSDGRIYYPRAHGVLRPGESMQIDVPAGSLPIKMIVLDYGERDRRMQRHAQARVEIIGIPEARRQRPDRGRGWRHRGDRARHDVRPYDAQSYVQPYDTQPYAQPHPYVQSQPYVPPQSYVQPQPYVAPQPYVQAQPRFEWRGGVWLRIE